MPSMTETVSPFDVVRRALQWTAYCLIVFLSLGILYVQFLGNLSSEYRELKIFDGEPEVPCYFIFGDSLSDNGNNNNLDTEFRSNYTPYGVDFSSGPTGRFTNDRLIVDIIAQLLGFEEFIPPFANLTGADILKGVNYASAGSGIRNETGSQGGEVIYMDKQLQHHFTVVSTIVKILGSRSAARRHLGKCMYTVITGNNDYINNYFMPDYYNTSEIYTPEQYAEVLVEEFAGQLQTLYSYGARKVAVFGLGLIGEVPEMIARFGSNYTMVDAAAELFNENLIPVVYSLNDQLNGAEFTYINSSGIADTSSYDGINVLDPCCPIISGQGGCVPGSIPCSNRSLYAFFDGFHPTDVVNEVLAGRAYKKLLDYDASPYDISDLVQLGKLF